MLCPNCGLEFEDGNKCPHCKVDVVVYKKITHLSDSLYNKGLSLAKASNLSGAVTFLKKSIQINKDNVLAYNLLGLVHFEMGHIGEAVREWVISTNRFKENNPAARYIGELSSNSTLLEKLSDSVSMYNNALTYLIQKSEDLAIIQLKKAIELNPKFVDALNLLTLCYLIQQEKEKASQLVEKVLFIDVQNPLALNYHNELHPGRKPRRTAPGAAQPNVSRATAPSEPYKPPINIEKKRVNFHLAEIISFIIGAGCMFAVFNWMMMPALKRESVSVQDNMQLEYIAKEQEYLTQIKNKDDNITALEESITTLEGEIEEAAAQNELQLNTNRVLQAYNMFTDGRLQEAVDQAEGIDLTGQPPDIVERHQSIFTLAYPQLGTEYFNTGSEAFDAEDFAKARVEFEKSAVYSPPEAEYLADLHYELGYCYAQDEATKTQAIEYLTVLLENYPRYNSRRRNTAQGIVNDLTAAE